MRIAISIWDDKISPVLDTASKLLIIDKGNQKESCRFEANLFEQDIYQRCSFIRKLDLDVLILIDFKTGQIRAVVKRKKLKDLDKT